MKYIDYILGLGFVIGYTAILFRNYFLEKTTKEPSISTKKMKNYPTQLQYYWLAGMTLIIIWVVLRHRFA